MLVEASEKLRKSALIYMVLRAAAIWELEEDIQNLKFAFPTFSKNIVPRTLGI